VASYSTKQLRTGTRQRALTFRVVGNVDKMTDLHSALGAMQRIADTVRENGQVVLSFAANSADRIYDLSKELYASARIAEPEMYSKPTQQLVQRTLPSRDRADIAKFLRSKTSHGTLILDKQSIDIKKSGNRWTYWLRIPVKTEVPEGKKGRRVSIFRLGFCTTLLTLQLSNFV